MWHKTTFLVVLLVVIAHVYVDASGTIPKKLKKNDIYNPNDHYLTDTKTKFPGRLTCYGCDSEDDPACILNPSEEKLVDCLYPALCYHFVNVTDGATKRGCTDDVSGYFLERCETNQEECKVCKGTNCNNAPGLVSCSSCTSSVDCGALTDKRVGKPKVCKEYRDKCYTFIGREGVERGCVSSKPEDFVEKCEANPDKCSICVDPFSSRGCNRQKFDLEFCVDCDSTKNRDMCEKRPTLFRNKICNGFSSDEKEGCYLSIKGDHHKKGCVRELSPEDSRDCKGQSKQCKVCHDTNCNIKPDLRSYF